ncbi:MAG TPA: glutathione synthase [Candidatus Thiothrix moscowensis]|uniref:glutathione synthase n=1 Tax=unclassified Thiothrix TaxID=2636184 RepID=UPI0025D7F15B|nr:MULTISPECIES: glutathione synthase [unclassified Thiothrix]HRJ52352.1 glutathione synthase [Candidatus Thiothrix moscowensis]HRJ92667.1 glutathione synthase [Candidatus Thiothrix moscowensis]
MQQHSHPYTVGIVMDPIASINIKKDSTFAMMLEAQRRGCPLFHILQGDLFADDGVVYAKMNPVTVRDDPSGWYAMGDAVIKPLHELPVILMRKDPPFDMEYIYSTYLLELVQKRGTLVVNRPESIRAANEKLFTAWFPEFCPPTRVTRDMGRIREFLSMHQCIVVKPLDGMGGSMIFQVRQDDPNRNVILETITAQGQRTVMAQRFLPEYKQGDKRILLIDGEPFPHALARIPAEGEGRANLAAGGTGVGVDLTAREFAICAAIGPVLRDMGLMFVGLDVIGDYVTEINVTSPTCIRELDYIYSANIASLLLDAIENRLAQAA